jgi:hypothetical protein
LLPQCCLGPSEFNCQHSPRKKISRHPHTGHPQQGFCHRRKGKQNTQTHCRLLPQCCLGPSEFNCQHSPGKKISRILADHPPPNLP